jgi:Tfp pilus assembly pilus retraction ATPase PilT
MVTLNASLGELVKNEIVTYEAAIQHAPDRRDFMSKYGSQDD